VWGLLWGGAGSPSNTMSLGPRPTSVSSGILIRQTVWLQYTNVTNRQTDSQAGQTVLQTVAQKTLNWTEPNWSWCLGGDVRMCSL